MPEQKPRQIAYEVLADRARSEGHTEDLLHTRLDRVSMKPVDRALCQELVYGVVRRQRTLDWLIERKAPGRKQAQGVQDALRLGLYQLLWLDRVPDHAAVFETVNLVRAHGMAGLSGFVNAVLRRYADERQQTKDLLRGLRESDPGITYSHPDWMIRRWKARWGWERTAKLLEWNNATPGVHGRINQLKTTTAEVLDHWKRHQIDAVEVQRDWLAPNEIFHLGALPGVHRLESFRNGWFYVQDPSTLLAPKLLAPKPGDTILDYCAAPGGKTAYLAQLTHGQSPILAYDIDEARLRLVRENCARLGLQSVKTVTAAQLMAQHQGQLFDAVLVDAPCSNTGVLRRRLDVRWRLSPEGIPSHASEQLRILTAAAGHVRQGGRLVYSTCSLEPEENREVVDAFLKNAPGFALESERTLEPTVDEVDGAYAALLSRGPTCP